MKYVVVDDQPAMSLLIEQLLKRLRTRITDPIHAVHSSDRLIEVLDRTAPDRTIVILDLALPGLKRLGLVQTIRRRYPEVSVIAYSGDDSPFLATDVIKEGAQGYVCKTSPITTLIQAIQDVQAGRAFLDPRLDFARAKADPWNALTPRQQEVCLLILRYGSVRQVAEAEGRNYDTIWNHWSNAKKGLGVGHEAELAKYFYSNGLKYLLDD